jgi:hypothetical protein
VCDIADHARAALVHHLGADRGAQSIGANQCRALEDSVIFSCRTNSVAQVLERGNPGERHQLDVAELLACVEQNAMEVDPVDHDVGALEALSERGAGRNAHDDAGIDGVDH